MSTVPGASTTAAAHTTEGAHAAGSSVPDGTHAPQGASLGELFSHVSADLSTLVRQEVALAKAEVTQSATKAGKGAGMLAGAGVAGHFLLLFLSVALWWGLGDATGHAWSALVVAAIWGIIAAVLAARGRKEIQQVRGLPKTTATVKAVPNALKGDEPSHTTGRTTR